MRKTDEKREPSRRELFRSLARGLALGALAAGTAALAVRKPGPTCARNGACRGCPTYTECDLATRQ